MGSVYLTIQWKVSVLDNVWVTSDHLQLYTDASGVLGFSAVLGSQWFACKWPF
jgi:hypothetical protein